MSRLLSVRKFAISLAMFAVVILSSAAAANADQVVINTPNAGLSGTPGPYATVTYTLNGTGGIDVSVQMALGFTAFGQGNGNNGLFGFNIVGSTAGLAVTNFNPAFLTANLGGGQMDGFGNFDVTIDCCNPSNAITSFSFTVTRTGGFSSASDLFEPNGNGAHFAIHVAPTNGNLTGFAADSGTATPEPASMLLLGTGLVTVAVGLRRRRKT
jgi:PEP-CTERM motif-containing protein